MKRIINNTKMVMLAFFIITFPILSAQANAQYGGFIPDSGIMENGETIWADGCYKPLPEPDGDLVKLEGVVKGPDGKTVKGVWVHSWSEDTWFGNGAETDEAGAFSIEVMAGGNYDIFVDSYSADSAASNGLIGGFLLDTDAGTGNSPGADGKWAGTITNEWEKRTIFSVNADGVNSIEITLLKGSLISGIFLDNSGQPIADIWIDAYSEQKGGWGGGITDEKGNYSFSVMPGEGYRISAWPWNSAFMGGSWKSGQDSPLTESGQDGILTQDWEQASLVNALDNVSINIIIPEPATISGRITDTDGEAVSGIWVEALHGTPYFICMDGEPAVKDQEVVEIDETDVDTNEDIANDEFDNGPVDMIWPGFYGAVTDENGNYTIPVAPDSDYRVSVQSMGGYQTVYYKNATNWDDATLIDASKGSVSGIDISMNMGESISGTVSGLAKDDILYIDVFNDSNNSRGYTSVTGTGSDLQFKVRGLAPGNGYKINIYAQGYLNGYLKNDSSVGTWEQAGLFSTQTADISIKMSTGSTISGTVSGLKQGEYAWIDAWSESTGSWGGSEISGTGSPVEFTIKGLAQGSDFIVSLWARDYVSETRTNISSTDSTPVNFTVSTGQTISGSITGAAPNKPVWVNAWSETSWNSGYAEVKADENGNAQYTIEGVGKTSDYIVSASMGKLYLYYNQQLSLDKAEKVDLSKDSVQGIDFNFGTIETYTLSGVIQGLEDNSNFVWIDALDESTGLWGGAEITGNGSFSIELPGNANYKISFYADMYFPVFFDSASGSLVSDWETAKPVSVSADVNIGTITFTDDFKWDNMPIPEPDPVNGDIEPAVFETDKERAADAMMPEDDFIEDELFFAF